ncbi:hypothetical protein LIER_15723 [Lithospermum erythrorhizon]|uniref:Probable histone-arginine methyltransferase CARM1-like N-terminal PH domain-containing protein n=1 Tax=Lithospermum erythrorhizon TaxID=34254 RepID=A0AAV3Q4C9_LITER
MESPIVESLKKQQVFHVGSILELTSSVSSELTSSPVVASFSSDGGVNMLRFVIDNEANKDINFNLQDSKLLKLGPVQSVCMCEATETNKESLMLPTFHPWCRHIIQQFLEQAHATNIGVSDQSNVEPYSY